MNCILEIDEEFENISKFSDDLKSNSNDECPIIGVKKRIIANKDVKIHFTDCIIECYRQKKLQLDSRKFISQPGQYGEPPQLFIIICNIFPNLNSDKYIDLLDIMPYIDEYLEYYS